MVDPALMEILSQQNPWHRQREVPDWMAPPRERIPGRWLWTRLGDHVLRRFQIVLGPRRTGKTVTMYQTVRHLINSGVSPHRIWWASLDHPLARSVSLDVLVRFFIKRSQATLDNPSFVFLDELVSADMWDLWLKQFYDQHLPIRLVASASAASALRRGRLESEIGRWDETYLGPCLLNEAMDLVGSGEPIETGTHLAATFSDCLQARVPPRTREIRDRLLTLGGYPELLLGAGVDYWPRDRQVRRSRMVDLMGKLRADSVERVVYRDIQQWVALPGPSRLNNLVYLLADRTGTVVSPEKLARDLSVTPRTVESYLSYLEWSFLAFPLLNYSAGEAAKQRRGRKFYLVDPALRSAILRRLPFEQELGSIQGQLIENLAASHLHALGRQDGIRVFHWRHRNREVDLIYDDPRQPMAFEVALSRRHGRTGLRSFMEQHPRFGGHCYLVVAHQAIALPPEESPDGVGEMPLDLFLLAVGGQHDQALARRLGVALAEK